MDTLLLDRAKVNDGRDEKAVTHDEDQVTVTSSRMNDETATVLLSFGMTTNDFMMGSAAAVGVENLSVECGALVWLSQVDRRVALLCAARPANTISIGSSWSWHRVLVAFAGSSRRGTKVL
jgi:hypothetical protein